MKKIIKTIQLPYSAEQIFNIVNDVAAYPDYLSWCESTKVMSESQYEMIATVTIGKVGLDQSFKTRNHLVKGKRIEMTLLEGPFKSMHGVWEFEDLPEGGCEVRFGVEFEATSSLLSIAIEPIFSGLARTMMNSLGARAEKIYGPVGFDG